MPNLLAWLITFLLILALVFSYAGLVTKEEELCSKVGLILAIFSSLLMWVSIIVAKGVC